MPCSSSGGRRLSGNASCVSAPAPAVFPPSPAACRPHPAPAAFSAVSSLPCFPGARRLSGNASCVSAPAPAAFSPSPALCRLPVFRRQQPAVFCPWRLPLFSPSAACRLSPPVSAPSRRRLPAVFLTRRCVCRFSAVNSLACVGPGACRFSAVTCPCSPAAFLTSPAVFCPRRPPPFRRHLPFVAMFPLFLN